MPYRASSGRSYCVAFNGSGALISGCAATLVGSSVLVVPAKPIGEVQFVVPSPRVLECRKLVRGSRAIPIAAPNWKVWVFLVHEKSSVRLCRGTWKLWL